MTGAQPDVSVVVPTRDRRDSVLRLLGALAAQTLDAARFEVVVSVDGSEDGTVDAVRDLQCPFALRVLWQPPGGRAAACNAGVLAARGRLVVLEDDDMVPVPGCLEAHLAAHAGSQPRFVVGAAPIEPGPCASGLERYMAAKFGRHLARLAEPGFVFGVRDTYSGNASVEREVLLAVGLFDERFRQYGNEDLELAVRLRDAGVELAYCEAAAAVQRYEKSFAEAARDAEAKGRTAVQFARRHPDVAGGLTLAHPRAVSRRWRWARNAVLGATGAVPSLRRALGPVAAALERRAPGHLTLYYDFVLDTLYWSGVRTALAGSVP